MLYNNNNYNNIEALQRGYTHLDGHRSNGYNMENKI